MKWSEEDKVKKDNIKKLFSDPKQRPVVFITLGIVVGVIGLSFFGMGGTADDPVQSNAAVGRAPSVTHQPGANASQAHSTLQEEANRRALEASRTRNQSSVPVLTGNNVVDAPLVLPTAPVAQQPTIAAPVVTPIAPPVQQPQVYQPQVEAAPAAPAAPSTASDQMNKQIIAYLNMWGPAGNQQFQEYSYVGKAESSSGGSVNNPTQGLQNNQVAQMSQVQPNAQQESAIRYLRAGTTVPAMLTTPLNSDSPGPVLAQVTTGPLAGARLIGTMSVNKETITVTFNTISKPGWPDVYQVNAVALSEDQSTGLATHIDRHYFQRYLGMFGGTYLREYGRAMQQQGQTSFISDSGNIVSERDELNTRQIQKAAQGGVLGSLGQEWNRSSNRDATIKVENKNGGGVPIRLLFLQNF